MVALKTPTASAKVISPPIQRFSHRAQRTQTRRQVEDGYVSVSDANTNDSHFRSTRHLFTFDLSAASNNSYSYGCTPALIFSRSRLNMSQDETAISTLSTLYFIRQHHTNYIPKFLVCKQFTPWIRLVAIVSSNSKLSVSVE